MIGRGETELFRNEEADGQSAFGDKFSEYVVFGLDFGEAFETVGHAEKDAAEHERAGAGG